MSRAIVLLSCYPEVRLGVSSSPIEQNEHIKLRRVVGIDRVLRGFVLMRHGRLLLCRCDERGGEVARIYYDSSNTRFRAFEVR